MVRGTVSLSSTRESNEGTSVIFRDCITFNERASARCFFFSLLGSGGSFGRRVSPFRVKIIKVDRCWPCVRAPSWAPRSLIPPTTS